MNTVLPPSDAPLGGHSLVNRITGLVIGVSLAALALHVLLLQWLVQPLLEQSSEHVVAEVRLARQLLLQAAPSQRAEAAARLTGMGVLAAREPPVTVQSREFPLLTPLRAQLGPELRVHGGSGTDGRDWLYFETRLGDETWWLTVQSTQPPAGAPLLPILASIAMVGLAAAAALVLGLRQIARPLAALSSQLLNRREQLRPLQLPEHASIELRQVIDAFNALVAAVENNNRARRQLLAGLSHDLRTPLARLQLRVDCECPEAVASRLEPDFLQLSRIIGQFLSYTQIDSGVPLGMAVPVGWLAQQLVGEHPLAGQSLFMGAGAEIEARLPELALRRVLGNLIDNALHYGEAPVEVMLQQQDDMLELWVLDAGCGIPPEQFQHAQQPFVKLRAENQSVGHCGLGLAIVAQLATQLGGRVVLRNFDGQRTGVGIRVPRP